MYLEVKALDDLDREHYHSHINCGRPGGCNCWQCPTRKPIAEAFQKVAAEMIRGAHEQIARNELRHTAE